MLERKPLTARRAATIIATYTLAITLAGGILARLLDRHDFHSAGAGIWWALQTVTTVGYGDVVPHSVAGRAVGVVIMVSGIGFLTVITAAVTATLIEAVRERRRGDPERDIDSRLDEIAERLAQIEARLDRPDR
jgi:voltage-gated potassium channel Kch